MPSKVKEAQIYFRNISIYLLGLVYFTPFMVTAKAQLFRKMYICDRTVPDWNDMRFVFIATYAEHVKL